MLVVTPAQKQKFKDICNFKFNGKIEYIIISLLNNHPDIVDKLLLNSTSFNYIIDNESLVETVPVGWQTNGSYRNVESLFSNEYTKCINVGMVIEDIRNVEGAMTRLKNTLGMVAYMNKMRLVIGDTVQINHTKNTNSIIYKCVPEFHIVDVTFKYFRQLFK